MRFSTKTKYSFLAFLFAIGLMGCGDSSIAPVIDGPSSPKYLLDGTLSNVTDANGFAYYTNGNEAYVARGTNTSATPEIPDEVTLGGKTYSVTGVYHSGFAKADITSITLPLSIETIDYQAFANSQLTSVTIPCNVAAMGSGAFMNCHSLAAVQFKNDNSSGSSTIGVCGGGGGGGGGGSGSSHLETIPDYCFFNCESLTTVSFPRALTTVNSCAFANCVGLTKLAFLSGFTTLKTLALESCTSLEEVYFPSTFTSASGYPANCEEGAFYNVKSSCTIYLSTTSDSIYNTWKNNKPWRYFKDAPSTSTLALAARQTTDIGLGSDYLYRVENGKATIFSYAPSTFPNDGVVVMPNKIDTYNVAKAETTTYASYKTQITQIYLSNNLESIENGFFAGMTALTTVSSTGDGCYTPQDYAIDLSSMTKLTTVGTYLFKDATYMTGTFSGTLTLPVSLTTIKEGAFQGLSKGTRIAFASGTSLLTSIGTKAFMNFGQSRGDGYGDSFGNNTFDLTLPATCTTIGSQAFSAVYGLKKITFEGASGKTLVINSQAFAYCRTLCEIIFPTENTEIQIKEKAFYCCSAGSQKSFMKISGLEQVFIPKNVTELGDSSFAGNERACFFFESASNPASFNANFNVVFTEGNSTDLHIKNKYESAYIGIIENNPVYMNVGFDGSSSSKKRYIQTEDFCFVETGVSNGVHTGEFICARYRYKPDGLTDNTRVTATVPEYIKFTPSTGDAAYAGVNSTNNNDFKVVSIGDSCFSSCYSRNQTALAVVNIPHGIKRIGDNAFLRSIFFNKLTAYTGNTPSADYTFPSSLKYIGRSAFACTRLKKALSIPGDVMTFDMISAEALDATTMPISMDDIDKTSPKLYSTSENQPTRYSSIFANDWLLEEVTFTTVNDPTMSFNSTLKALYRLKEVDKNGTVSARIQLLMICGRLSGFSEYSTDDEKDKVVTAVDVTIGETTNYTFLEGTKSIRYGALRMANWAKAISLDSTMEELFPKKWDNNHAVTDTPVPQSLLTACVNLPKYLNIGITGNDKDYTVRTTTFGIKGSINDFMMPIGILRNAQNLTSMTIPANITEIPAFAFDQATEIKTWITPNSSGVLKAGGEAGGESGADGILDLRYTSLETIGTSAFWGLNKTTKVYLPHSLTTLGKDGMDTAKRSCFERFTNKSTASSLIEVDMTAADQLTEALPQRCFGSHASLATVKLPPNIPSIESNCFIYCPISSITWPTTNNFISIKASAFEGSRMVDLQIPNTVKTLGDKAFQNNTAMTMLRLPLAMESVLSASQFNGCTALNQVYFTAVRTARDNKSLKLADSCFPASVKYAMLPQFVNDGNNSQKTYPFKACTNLQKIFYGAKASEASNATTITSYSNGGANAPIYYYVDSAADITNDSLLYWRPKPNYPHIAQIVTKSGNNLVAGTEYDFSQVIA